MRKTQEIIMHVKKPSHVTVCVCIVFNNENCLLEWRPLISLTAVKAICVCLIVSLYSVGCLWCKIEMINYDCLFQWPISLSCFCVSDA